MPDHLLLPPPRQGVPRRAAGRGGSGPPRDRPAHGAHLTAQIAQVTTAPRRLDAGIDPDLVFKIHARARPADGGLEGRELQVLGETRDFTYFVLSERAGTALAATITDYSATGDMRSLLDLIDDIEPYGPEDRRGPGLDGPRDEEPVRVDVTIWASGDYTEAQRRAAIVDQVLEQSGSVVELRSVGVRRNLVRALVTPSGLDDLLDTSVVEQVRTPPVPFLDFRDWRALGADDLQRIEVTGGVVGVLDDAPAAQHALLAGLVESIDEIAPPGYAWQQPGHHGSEVVGRVLLPRLHEELRDGLPITAMGTVRVARVLEPDPNRGGAPPRFPTSGFPHELVEQGIRLLHDNYGVRTFNLSFGYSEPFSDVHLGALTETIDELVRELDIVVVVPTGNAPVHPSTARTDSGHHVADEYPAYMTTPEHRLSEPGPSALSVSVGSIAHSEGVAEIAGRHAWQAVAGVHQISPFSRTGPGTGTSQRRRNKPDLVHYGGNVVLNDAGHLVQNDLGASIISTALDPSTGRLFSACNGTSYAGPPVARIAADIEHAYPEASANLIRALLATSAQQPDPAIDIVEDHERAAIYGLGVPDSDRAITSGGSKATMIYDGSLPVDTARIHPVPVPEEFRRGTGAARTITVALAFDPPVRRQRREYVAASMKYDLYRDIDPDELQMILSEQDPDDRTDLITDRRHLQLAPGSTSMLNSTLQLRSWTARNSFIDDDEVFLLAVTHRAQTWARNDPEYREQRYALAVTLEDQHLQHLDLRELLLQRVRVPARVRLGR